MTSLSLLAGRTVIQKFSKHLQVNETVQFYVNISTYAKQWLNVSTDVRLKITSMPGVSIFKEQNKYD